MRHQLEFWTAAEKTAYEQGQWESLSTEEQAEKIALLARLLAKALCPQLVDQTQENSHEQ
jgi:hypothetical protein